jgi:hypothetical protein
MISIQSNKVRNEGQDLSGLISSGALLDKISQGT